MFKWFVRIFGGLVLLVVIASASFYIAFEIWVNKRESTLAAGSQIASTRLGDIEYAISGEGEARILIHGTPGGYDQVMISPRTRPENFTDMQVIGVSRPGYLKTPLSSGATFEEQADLYAALLDELGIEKTVIYAASGGAPSGLQFAIRHPEKTKALILLVPLLTKLDADGWTPPSNTLLTIQDFSIFLFKDAIAKQFITGLNSDDPIEMQHASEIMLSNTPAYMRIDGQANDIAQFAKLDVENWPLEKIAVPTLFIHGNRDQNAPYQGSVDASARMPKANLITMDGGDHYIVITQAAEINEQIMRFLDSISNP